MAVFTDDFERADSADLGANWSIQAPAANAAAIVSGKVRSTVFGSDSRENYNVATLTDGWAQITIATFTGTGKNYAGVRLRASNSAADFYEFYALRNNSSGTDSVIEKQIAGLDTSLTNEGLTTWAATDTVKGETIATTLKLYRNGSGTALLTITDAAIASGLAGCKVTHQTAGTVADTEVGDFSAGDFPDVNTDITPRSMLKGT
jgi:hypothetical protein